MAASSIPRRRVMSEEPSRARWEGPDYARNAGHHRAADEWFLARRPPARTEVVVDLGCGSGEFTARLASMVPEGRVIGVDVDASMLEQARRHDAANLSFVRAAAERVDEVVEPGSVDLVTSRAMLHWLPAEVRPALFRAVLHVLAPGGAFHAEGAAPGNVHLLVALLDDLARRHGLPVPPAFPDIGEVYEELEAAGFALPEGGVQAVAQRRSFTAAQLEGFLRTQAMLVLTRHAAAEDAAGLVEEALGSMDRLRRADGSLDQTFVRLDLLAHRPPAGTRR